MDNKQKYRRKIIPKNLDRALPKRTQKCFISSHCKKTGINISHSVHTSEPEEEQWRRKKILFFRLWKDHRRRLLFSAFNLAFSYSLFFIFFIFYFFAARQINNSGSVCGSNIKKDMSKIIMNNVKKKKKYRDLESHWEATRLNIYTLCTVPIYRYWFLSKKQHTYLLFLLFFFLTKLATFIIIWQWNRVKSIWFKYENYYYTKCKQSHAELILILKASNLKWRKLLLE